MRACSRRVPMWWDTWRWDQTNTGSPCSGPGFGRMIKPKVKSSSPSGWDGLCARCQPVPKLSSVRRFAGGETHGGRQLPALTPEGIAPTPGFVPAQGGRLMDMPSTATGAVDPTSPLRRIRYFALEHCVQPGKSTWRQKGPRGRISRWADGWLGRMDSGSSMRGVI